MQVFKILVIYASIAIDILVERTFKNQCVTLDLEKEELLDEGKPLGTRGLPPVKI